MAKGPSDFSIPEMIETLIDEAIKPGLLKVEVLIDVESDLQGIVPTSEELDTIVQLYKDKWAQVSYTEFSGPDGYSGKSETASVRFVLKAR